jgi:uncharacterized protein (TIGR02118 family)
VRKFITSFKRRPGMSVDAFREHWATVHAEKVSRLPGILRYVQNSPTDSSYSHGREPAFDAVAEVWFDADAADRLESTPEWAEVQADAPNFGDMGSIVTLPVDDVEIIDGRPAALKLVMFVRRRADLTVAQFRDHWRHVHGPLAARNPYVRRYVQCHVREPAAGKAPAAFDGVGIVWFDTMDDIRASGTAPEAAAANEDGPRFADGGAPAATLVMSETSILA